MSEPLVLRGVVRTYRTEAGGLPVLRGADLALRGPGDLDGAAGLRFMGVLDAEHNYRPKIF